jgi:hypothetical protein
MKYSSINGNNSSPWIFIEAIISLFGCWTFLYHLGLVFHVSAIIVITVTLIVSCLLIAMHISGYTKHSFDKQKTNFKDTLLLAILATFPGCLNLFIQNPNPDDAQFFHRAFSQIGDFDAPFYVTDTLLNVRDVPALSNSHLISSYEPLIATISWVISVDPIFIVHNIVPFFIGAIYVYAIFNLYKEFGLNDMQANAAIVTQYLFLFSDIQLLGGPSYGNMIINLWNGKVILWLLMPPLVLLYLKRTFNDFNWKNYLSLFSLSFCAVGLTGSGVPFFPVLIFLGITSIVFANRKTSKSQIINCKLKKIAFMSCAAIYPIFLGFLIYAKIISMPQNMNVWNEGWPLLWSENLQILINDRSELIRNILLVGVIPFIVLRNRFFIYYSLFFVIFFANQITGPILIDVLQPGSYWRILFALPVVFCSGFLVLSLNNALSPAFSVLSIGAVFFVAWVFLFQGPTMKQIYETTIRWKSPLVSKIDHKSSNFIQKNRSLLNGANILAPDELSLAIALTVPKAKFDSIRGFKHLLSNSIYKDQINSREAARIFVSNCDSADDDDLVVSAAIDRGVNLIILKGCRENIPRYLKHYNGHIDLSFDDTYRLFKTNKLN